MTRTWTAYPGWNASITSRASTRKHATPVILPDKPWEQGTPRTICPAALFLWSSAIWNQATSKWQIWYCGGRHALPLYAESTDGIDWTKPDLGLVRWDGSTQNNIVSLLPPDGYSTSWKHPAPVADRAHLPSSFPQSSLLHMSAIIRNRAHWAEGSAEQ